MAPLNYRGSELRIPGGAGPRPAPHFELAATIPKIAAKLTLRPSQREGCTR